MKKSFAWLVLVVLALTLIVGSAAAEPTAVTVRVRSKGAKFIGSSMGGVLIMIKDADTGELLAKGKVSGGTGDTDRIMKTALKTGENLATPEAAAFTTTLNIDEPRYLEITAYGPLAQRQAANRVSLTQWLIPGKPLTGGDAMLLEMPGMIVDVQAPPTHIKLKGLPQKIEVSANVTLMCGCPIDADGIWKAADFEVRAIIKRNGAKMTELPLNFAGRDSQFAAELTLEQAGTYEGIVYAYQAANGNSGLDSFTLVIK